MACGTSLGASTDRSLRKIVTALFCDLVGSTSLGEGHDPELLRPVLERYFAEMRGCVERHGGHVEKFIGDAVVAVFGIPNAHEDDGLRAVRAAVEMQERLAGFHLTGPIPLAIRIGVTTGEVLLPGDGLPIIGDAMNTASRLQSAAEPGDVLIGEPTWRLVRDDVVAEELGPVSVRGKAEPVTAWRVVDVRPGTGPTGTLFVGRHRHMRLLEAALEDAIEARRCVSVTVLAPPGVGKSRLAEAFAEEVRDRATVLVGQTPAYGEGITFAPLVEMLGQAAGRPSGEAEDVAAGLRELLASQPDGTSVGERLAQFLGVGDALGADTAWALRRLLEVLALERPLVVMLEDAHWGEAPMLELVGAALERAHGPVLFVCLARPELLEQHPTWASGRPRASTTTLPPLQQEDARRVAEALLGSQAPRRVVDRVCDAAEGNPLYLEQLIAMMSDLGLLVDGEWMGASDAEVEIPETLQALLAARLDRLDPVSRLILERACIEGRRFRIAAVRALAPELSPAEVESRMASLSRGDLVHPEDGTGERWRFAHALVLEATYRSISKVLRADLHEQLADWLAAEDADQTDVDESVARHLERALQLREELGMRDAMAELEIRAGALFAAAGSRAFAALDFITSGDLLGRAANLLPDLDPRRLDLLPNLGVALTETGRPEETDALLSKAVEQSRAVGSERNALRATIQLLSNRVYRSPTGTEIDAAVTEAEAASDALEALDDQTGLAEAAIAIEYLEYMQGRIARQHEWSFRALGHAFTAGRPREAGQAAADIVGSAVDGPLPFGGVQVHRGGATVPVRSADLGGDRARHDRRGSSRRRR